MAKKPTPVVMRNKNDNFVGTINMTELIINRAGKVNSGVHQGLGTKVHKSKKVYDRNREKQKMRNFYY